MSGTYATTGGPRRNEMAGGPMAPMPVDRDVPGPGLEPMGEVLRRTAFHVSSGHVLLDQIEEALSGPIPKEAGVNQPKPVGGMEGQLQDTMAASAGLCMRLERLLARLGKPGG